MHRRGVGNRDVAPIGLGAMPMSLEGRPDRTRSIRTIHAALDAGVELIDTADAYSKGAEDTGHNERLIAEALHTWGADRTNVVVATKGGHIRPGDGSWIVDGRPEHLRRACEASLRNLDRDVIDLYQLHRPDPDVPFAESVGALAELQQEGKVRQAGLSNVTVEQIDEARTIVRVASVQNELSPAFRSSRGELAHCERHGIAFLAWSPLGGMGAAAGLGGAHQVFRDVAERHGASPQQVALAWLLALSPACIPIPGASRPETILDSVRATELELSDDELAALGAA